MSNFPKSPKPYFEKKDKKVRVNGTVSECDKETVSEMVELIKVGKKIREKDVSEEDEAVCE